MEVRDRNVIADELLQWIRNKPEAISVLRRIASEKAIHKGKELIPELENMHLVRNGKSTLLGKLVQEKLK